MAKRLINGTPRDLIPPKPSGVKGTYEVKDGSVTVNVLAMPQEPKPLKRFIYGERWNAYKLIRQQELPKTKCQSFR